MHVGRPRVVVDAHQHRGVRGVGDGAALGERDGLVRDARHDHAVALGLQQALGAQRDVEVDVLLRDAVLQRPGVVASMSRVEANHRTGRLTGGGAAMEHHDPRDDHDDRERGEPGGQRPCLPVLGQWRGRLRLRGRRLRRHGFKRNDVCVAQREALLQGARERHVLILRSLRVRDDCLNHDPLAHRVGDAHSGDGDDTRARSGPDVWRGPGPAGLFPCFRDTPFASFLLIMTSNMTQGDEHQRNQMSVY